MKINFQNSDQHAARGVAPIAVGKRFQFCGEASDAKPLSRHDEGQWPRVLNSRAHADTRGLSIARANTPNDYSPGEIDDEDDGTSSVYR